MRILSSLKWFIFSILILVAAISLYQGLHNALVPDTGSRDFQWQPSRLLLEHSDPYALYESMKDKQAVFLSQHPNYPPSGLAFLWPYAVWDWPEARILWAFSNLFLTGVILFCLFQLLPPQTSSQRKLLITALFLISLPWRNGLGTGQHAIFSVSLFLLAVTLFRNNSRYSLLPYAASWLKYTITFPLSLFIARSQRGWKIILMAIAIHALLTLFLAAWTGSAPIDLLFGSIRVALPTVSPGYLDVYTVASRLGLSSRTLPLILSFVILGISYAAVRKDTDDLSVLSTLSFAAMGAVFHRGYDFIVLIIPLAYALRNHGRDLRSKLYLINIAVIWFVDKFIHAGIDNFGFTFFEVFLPYYFWIKVLVFYGALSADWYYAFKKHRISLPEF